MATILPPPSQEPRTRVDAEINRTRRALRRVDLIGGFLSLAIGVLLYLLAASLLEHWVVPGGWSHTARFVLLGVLVVGVAWYSVVRLLPLLVQPINPAFAARAIEEHSPGLKNTLLNLLMLRSHRRELSAGVYSIIERQANERISRVTVDSVVDRSGVLRLGYVLAAVIFVFGLYRVFSPKDVFTSAARVLTPWSDVAAPSRVQISRIKPGDTSVARGEKVTVSAEVLGLRDDEPVEVHYSSADGQIVDQAVPMELAVGAEYRAELPGRRAPGRGVEQELAYWIEAGDARSPRFHIAVFERPTIVVDKIRYDYPAYTGLASREITSAGDICAIEGTRVTIEATANKPIGAAHIDFEADGRYDLKMNADDRTATATFTLALRPDRRTPEHGSYALRYKTEIGRTNADPPKHAIDVLPDYAPETEILQPEEETLEVRIDQRVQIEVEARDPDFALADVSLTGQVGDRPIFQRRLLEGHHSGRSVGTVSFTPEEIGLAEGQEMEYWSTAEDNRTPEPGTASSTHKRLRVVASKPGERHFDQPPPPDQERQDPSQGGGGSSDKQKGEGQEGMGGEASEGGETEDQTGDQGGQPGESREQQAEGASQDQGQGGQQEGENQEGSEGEGQQQGEQREQSEDGQQRPGDPSSADTRPGEQGEQPQQQEKVAPDGSDDGTAFERIRNHFAEEDANNPEQGERQEPLAGSSAGEDQVGEQPSADEPGSDGPPQGRISDREVPGQIEKQPSEPGAEQRDSDGSLAHPEQGDPGSGLKSREDQPSVAQDHRMKKPREKNPDEKDQEMPPEGESPPTARKDKDKFEKEDTEHESDTKSGQSGDRSGGGGKGPGQQADLEGTGTAGEKTEADEGAGSQERGPGKDAQAGNEQQADQPTGEPGEKEPGSGTKQQSGSGEKPGGDQPQTGEEGPQQNGQPNDQQQAQPDDGEGEPQQGQDNPQPGQPGPGQQGNRPTEAKPSDAPTEGPPASGTGGSAVRPPPIDQPDQEDAANLEYAHEQTDLILERLDDQLKKKRIDEDLLEKLGWNADELRRFVDRWKNLKTEAAGGDDSDQARRALDEALKSLGLRKRGPSQLQSLTPQDRLRQLQEAYRGRVPIEYQDEVRAYLKGTAAGVEEKTSDKQQ